MPVVGVYETMPTPGYDYQSWMLAEVQALQRAVAEQVSTREAVMSDGERRSAAPRRSCRCEGVTVRLSGRTVLARSASRSAPGEFTGLIGSNGAGKTTLFRVILGLQSASAGRVLVDGRRAIEDGGASRAGHATR